MHCARRRDLCVFLIGFSLSACFFPRYQIQIHIPFFSLPFISKSFTDRPSFVRTLSAMATRSSPFIGILLLLFRRQVDLFDFIFSHFLGSTWPNSFRTSLHITNTLIPKGLPSLQFNGNSTCSDPATLQFVSFFLGTPNLMVAGLRKPTRVHLLPDRLKSRPSSQSHEESLIKDEPETACFQYFWYKSKSLQNDGLTARHDWALEIKVVATGQPGKQL